MLANYTIAIPRGVLLKVGGWAMVAHVAYTEPWYIGAIIGILLIGASSTKGLRGHQGRPHRRRQHPAHRLRRDRAGR